MKNLFEKASIDWNNYLTRNEVKQFISKDDKIESAEDIIYSNDFRERYRDLHNELQKKYSNSWTKRELVKDLASFYENGHLITERKDSDTPLDYALYYIRACDRELSKYSPYKDITKTITKKGQDCIKFNYKGKDIIVIWYPKKKESFYFCVDNKSEGYKNNINQILKYVDNMIEKEEIASHKLDEVSRNELLAKTKLQTKTRYAKSDGYKGFYVEDIDTNSLLTTGCLRVTCKVGDYDDTIEIQNVPYWIELIAKDRYKGQVNNHSVRDAILKAVDGMDIKVDCTCPDLCLKSDTEVKLLNGNIVTVKEMKAIFDKGEEIFVYSVNEKGDFKPGKVNNVWISGKSSKMIKVTLDNGYTIETTPEHLYMKRDGSYIEAQNLKKFDSLMPLYFKTTNGYENVKRNSSINATIFDSVYKIVADTFLTEAKHNAAIRSGENIIQIHHKDFNKLNNYPSNLYPMGKMEHWMYHAKIGSEHVDKFIKAGREFWKSDPRRFEALKKQKESARKYMINKWASMTKEEKAIYINKISNSVDKEKLSESLKSVWANYSDEERKNRLNSSNLFILNNPMLDETFINSEKMAQRNKKVSESLKEYNRKLTPEQRQSIHSWAKGMKFSEEHKAKIGQAHKGMKFSEESKKKISEGAKRSARKRNISKCFRNIKELIDSNIELSPDNFKHNMRNGDPHYTKIFDSFEDMIKAYNDSQSLFNHKVIDVEIIYYDNPIDVYDIEVDSCHNFYVNAGVILHNCYRFNYKLSQAGAKYGKQETRPAKIRNPENYGFLCKHLTAMLRDKKWLQQVAGTVMDTLEKKIDNLNKFLRLNKEEDMLTLPNELARRNAKKGFYSKLFKDQEPEEDKETDNKEEQDNKENEVKEDGNEK